MIPATSLYRLACWYALVECPMSQMVITALYLDMLSQHSPTVGSILEWFIETPVKLDSVVAAFQQLI